MTRMSGFDHLNDPGGTHRETADRETPLLGRKTAIGPQVYLTQNIHDHDFWNPDLEPPVHLDINTHNNQFVSYSWCEQHHVLVIMMFGVGALIIGGFVLSCVHWKRKYQR
jgi:hypothetical protein